MSKRMTSETIIFDTDWLTEADFGADASVTVSIDYQAYDTLKIITPPNVTSQTGGPYQEFEVDKLENYEPSIKILLSASGGDVEVYFTKYEGYSELNVNLNKSYWETDLKGIGSVYIKGVKR